MPQDEAHTEAAYRHRMALYQIQKNMDLMRQSQPEVTTIGQGVGIGLAMVGSSVVTEAAFIRLASGMRFVGSTRAATVIGRLSYVEGELFGVETGWKGYRGAFVKNGIGGAFQAGFASRWR